MNRAWKEIRQPRDQLSREVLVDEQLHSAKRLPDTRRILIDCGEVLAFKLWIIRENLALAHPRGQPVEHVPDGDPKPTDTRMPGTFSRLNRDMRSHDRIIALSHTVRIFLVIVEPFT